MSKAEHAAEQFAVQFATALVDRDFAKARNMLEPMLGTAVTERNLQTELEELASTYAVGQADGIGESMILDVGDTLEPGDVACI